MVYNYYVYHIRTYVLGGAMIRISGENSEGTDRSKERDRKENYFFRKYRKRKYKIY
jgi:hypothetical protein